MKTPKKEAASIGRLMLAISIISTVSAPYGISFNNLTENTYTITETIIAILFLFISICGIVAGVKAVNRREIKNSDIAILLTVLILLFASTFSGFVLLAFPAILVLGIIVLIKIIRYKSVVKATENTISNDFQYDGDPVSAAGQGFNYLRTENTKTADQGFSYIEEESSGVVNAQKKCIRCGKENDLNAKFCKACGYSKFINN